MCVFEVASSVKLNKMAKYRGFILMNCAGHTQISGQGRNAADSGAASNKISAWLQINRF